MLTDDDEVTRLNAEYRGVEKTTDVLSFPMREGPGAELHPQLLGDVVISVEQAARQSGRGRYRDELLEREVVRLLVHGLCHLRGMDHHRSKEAKKMEAEEARLLEVVT